MYTYNIYCYGHKLAVDPKLNNEIGDWDVYFNKEYPSGDYGIEAPYHGGQILGDTQSIVFGIQITTDDSNPDYVTEVRNSKEETYKRDYKQFVEDLKEDLLDSIESNPIDKETKEYAKVVNKLIKFLDTHEPEFYTVEASS